MNQNFQQINLNRLCYNCMEEKPYDYGPCPNCGYDNRNYQRGDNVLPPLTILNGKYILGRSLGAGGFGITYVAKDVDLQRLVAIKEYFLKSVASRSRTISVSVPESSRAVFSQNKERFLQEARTLAKLNDDENGGVVGVLEHFEENDTAYIVMEFLKGETLQEIVKRNGPMPYEEVKLLMGPVGRSLDLVHRHKVVHLDVSPDNIMIQQKNGKAKLLDFGTAVTLSDCSRNRAAAFKRGYAPLEQYSGYGKVGPWTDVYAFAATIYYCLTGQKPIDAMERQAGVPLIRPSAMGSDIPKRAEDALINAMNLEPVRRFDSLQAFWNAFEVSDNSKQKAAAVIGASAAAGIVLGILSAL